ncbi:MAG: GNAT family N-acetyltransferase [Candidatus Zixiibacteriota bacterium]
MGASRENVSVNVQRKPVPKMNEFTTRFLTEDDCSKWNRFVASSPSGSIYSTPEYLDALCSAAGGSFKILACLKGDEIAGGIGLYENTSPFGTFVSNRLLLYYNGLVLGNHKSSHPYQDTSRSIKIMSALEAALARCGYGRVLLHNRSPIADLRPFLAAGWRAEPSYTYVVQIDDLEKLQSRMEQNLRRLINRCESNDITFSDDDDFDSFFRMHEDTHQRKDAPLYLPRSEFRKYFEKLKSQNLCRLYQARTKEGRSIAAQLVLRNEHPVTHTVSAAADQEFLNIGSTPYLRWKAFEDLSAAGYEANDLTDAALNPVTRFKGQLGGDLETTFILTRPDALRFRVGESARSLYYKGRGAMGRLIKHAGVWSSR